MLEQTDLQKYFSSFKEQILGQNAEIETPYGIKKLIYADWTASGREYLPIENYLIDKIAPFIGNTHTETSFTGSVMTKAYAESKKIIKNHVNASDDDVLLYCGSGMTGSINKLQRMLGLRYPERVTAFTKRKNPLVQFLSGVKVPKHNKPIVFVSHMEHHSNHTSWLETIADVEIVEPDADGLVSIANFKKAIEKEKNRKFKIVSITACSNVTGIETPYHDIAELIHQYNGFCIVDFACSAPYVAINMHPENAAQRLDAVIFSPHKFLGGPATPGVLIFHKSLYLNAIPDNPGGGTVVYTNPWKFHAYITDIEEREDGGTPPFMQGIKTSLTVMLKDKMGISNIKQREEELVKKVFEFAEKHPQINILANNIKKRLPVFSFFINGIHYNLLVRILNDRFGIQMRGGCACAGTYGHILLNLNEDQSKKIYNEIIGNDNSQRPGWVRMSLHPTINDDELDYILNALLEVANNIKEWEKDYIYDKKKNQFAHVSGNCQAIEKAKVATWFSEALNA